MRGEICFGNPALDVGNVIGGMSVNNHRCGPIRFTDGTSA